MFIANYYTYLLAHHSYNYLLLLHYNPISFVYCFSVRIEKTSHHKLGYDGYYDPAMNSAGEITVRTKYKPYMLHRYQLHDSEVMYKGKSPLPPQLGGDCLNLASDIPSADNSGTGHIWLRGSSHSVHQFSVYSNTEGFQLIHVKHQLSGRDYSNGQLLNVIYNQLATQIFLSARDGYHVKLGNISLLPPHAHSFAHTAQRKP